MYRFDATLDIEADVIIDYSLVQLDENGRVVDPDFTQEELTAALIARLGEDFTDLQALEDAQSEASNAFRLFGCLKDCKTKLTDAEGNRMPGRGACRTDCWIDAIITVITVIGIFV
jgi:hypothetical protein